MDMDLLDRPAVGHRIGRILFSTIWVELRANLGTPYLSLGILEAV